MKWCVASDIHGSEFYCKQLLEMYKREQADRLLLLGDILYHGPRNDLPKGYAPKKVIELLNEYKEDIVCVRGNCDIDGDGIGAGEGGSHRLRKLLEVFQHEFFGIGDYGGEKSGHPAFTEDLTHGGKIAR